jgi:hypothetical protein
MKHSLFALIFSLVVLLAHSLHAQEGSAPKYHPASQALHDSIVRMDSTWEDSYNNCKLDVQEKLISEDLEFYHDRGGLLTSKKKLIEALKNNICGKVKRELLKGSIEVYPISNYGAVEMGYHRFRNSAENSVGEYARFIHLWRNNNGNWEITRVISLH